MIQCAPSYKMKGTEKSLLLLFFQIRLHWKKCRYSFALPNTRERLLCNFWPTTQKAFSLFTPVVHKWFFQMQGTRGRSPSWKMKESTTNQRQGGLTPFRAWKQRIALIFYGPGLARNKTWPLSDVPLTMLNNSAPIWDLCCVFILLTKFSFWTLQVLIAHLQEIISNKILH